MGLSFGKLAGVAALGVLLSGCALSKLVTGAPAPETYDLVAIQTAIPAASRRSKAQIVVVEPTSVRALAGDNILIKPSPESVTYLGNAVWSDTLPRLLQARLIETLEQTSAFRGVGDGRERIEADAELLTQVRAFQIDLDGTNGAANVDLFVKLVEPRSGRVLSSGTFQESVPVQTMEPESVVTALNRATQVILPKIADWTSKVAAR